VVGWRSGETTIPQPQPRPRIRRSKTQRKGGINLKTEKELMKIMEKVFEGLSKEKLNLTELIYISGELYAYAIAIKAAEILEKEASESPLDLAY